MIILLSKPISIKNEADYINHLFDEGLEIFHLRKPKYTFREVHELLNGIKPQYLKGIVIHSHYDLISEFPLKGIHLTRQAEKYGLARNLQHKIVSKTIHELEQLNDVSENIEYVFISPLFDSLSKPYYRANFTIENLKIEISKFKDKAPKTKLIALGGINFQNINTAKEFGFDGIAMLGYFWNNFSYDKKDLSEKFKTIYDLCQNSSALV